MEINVEITGVEPLMRRIQALGVDFEPIMERALERGAKRLQAEIKPLVPVDEGTLRNSISVEKAGRMKYAIGTNLKYAIPVEFGTGKFGDPAVPHTTKDSWVYYDAKNQKFVRTHGQPPAHYMLRGFNNGKDTAVAEVKREILKWLT